MAFGIQCGQNLQVLTQPKSNTWKTKHEFSRYKRGYQLSEKFNARSQIFKQPFLNRSDTSHYYSLRTSLSSSTPSTKSCLYKLQDPVLPALRQIFQRMKEAISITASVYKADGTILISAPHRSSGRLSVMLQDYLDSEATIPERFAMSGRAGNSHATRKETIETLKGEAGRAVKDFEAMWARAAKD